ncbi:MULTISPECIES: PfkB family carbohydrate kinase [unclassified Micromonospora]|uniref:1-phosphofructokinase family hexose kinase n=2 Tax=unclassified Micromonospora TaxID=2617518 RepID=UPI0020B368BF|nr:MULTISPECIES: PfkB family carbohydrate kinase [unclassified Micromonospora]MDM4779348.1 PfkB family carbohydrate kinase [Micromonospora sp. b486]
MDQKVMVFAPAPLLTVTIEQQGDVPELHLHPGGQGVWQTRMIAALGVPVTMCVGLGGEVGDAVRKLLDDEDVTVRVVRRESGTGWYVHDRRDGERTEIAEHPGAPMVRHDIDELYTVTLTEGLRAPVSVLSGPADPQVVDPDIYRRLAADLSANGGKVVADLSGPYLEAVLDGGVAVLKVSHEELLDDGLAKDDSVAALRDAGRRCQERGARTVLISRAGEPALALPEDGEPLLVHAPPLELADHRGAGDSMTAGVAAVLARGGDLREALRIGAAAGALNVTRHGLGTGRAEAVRELAGRVRLTPLDGGDDDS